MFGVAINISCLLLIIGVHEYGHYYFARKYGVFIPNFSIGIGSELFGFSNREGTRFSFRAIPFGGYVQFGDKHNVSEEDPLGSLTKWQRIKVYSGGPLANLLLCIAAALVLSISGNLNKYLGEYPWYLLMIIATVVTVLIFVAAVPLTAFLIIEILISPVKNMEQISGPIGIISGAATDTTNANNVADGMGIEILIFIWSLSLAVGTFNLIPISLLDGGRIFRELFSRHKIFIKIWSWCSGVLLLVLIVYLLGTDIFKLFAKD